MILISNKYINNFDISIIRANLNDIFRLKMFYRNLSDESKKNFQPLFFHHKYLLRQTFMFFVLLSYIPLIKNIFYVLSPVGFHFILVAKKMSKNKIVGMCYIWKKNINIMHLGIAVDDKYQNLGIGTNLIKRMINEAIILGIKNIGIIVHKNNKHAIYLYKKFGFRKIKQNKLYDSDLHNSLEMDLKLYNVKNI